MSDVAVNSNANAGYVIGGTPGFYDNQLKPEPTFTLKEVQSLINEAVTKGVAEALKQLSDEAGMPKFLMKDILELFKMLLDKMGPVGPTQQSGVSPVGGNSGAAPSTSGGGKTEATQPQQTVVVPTTPYLAPTGAIVPVVTDATASQYGVAPGPVANGATLTPVATSSQPTVSAATATSYADNFKASIQQTVYEAGVAAQKLAEGQGTVEDGKKKFVSGTMSSKSWLMAIAEALGGALGLKAQQMLNSTNAIANLVNVDKQLATQMGTATDEAVKSKIQMDQATNAHAFTLETSKLQGATQEFSMLQNAMSNTIKTLGESLGQLARKG